MDKILVHYNEIALKKGNRAFFVEQLVKNIKAALKNGCFGDVKIEKLPGGLLINYRSSTSIVDIIVKIPGVANFLPVWEAENLDDLKNKLATELEGKNFTSFRVTTQRGDKSFLKTSEEINREVGAFVVSKTNKKVDLKNPDFTVFIEIIKNRIFLSFEKIKGIGGLPVSSGGKAVSLLSGGIDSPVSSFMMMKRGCENIFVHFHAFPYLDKSSIEKAKELVSILNNYQNKSKLYLVSFGDIQKEILLNCPESYRVVVYRRLMMRIAEEIALKENAKALITGESLGQVASQTIENITVTNEGIKMPVFRPLIGMNKDEIISMAKKIGTYEISILPDQDCCQLFMPKRPTTRSNIETIKKIEEKINIKKMLAKIEYIYQVFS